MQTSEQTRVYNARYRQSHKEEIRAYCELHKEEIRTYGIKYRQAHKEETRARGIKYRELHKEELRAYRESHKEKIQGYATAPLNMGFPSANALGPRALMQPRQHLSLADDSMCRSRLRLALHSWQLFARASFQVLSN